MRFAQLGAFATAASVSAAFLLPPEISQADTDIIKTLPFEDAIAIDGRVVNINCPGCPVLTAIEGKTHVAQVDTVLQLNFSIAHDPRGNGADRLILNGHSLYPIDLASAALMEPLTAAQLTKSSGEQTSTPTLGYSVSVRHPVLSTTKDQIDLVEVRLEIMEVANKFLSSIPSVEIKLLETPIGKLMIGDATITAPKSSSIRPADGDQECTTLLCKWRSIFADRISQIKGGCGRKVSPAAQLETPKPHRFPGHRRPGHNHPHGAHRSYRHHRHGAFSRLLRGIVLHVLIPVLIGIMVGITASLVGMVVGQVVVFTWRLFFRSNSAPYTKVQQEENHEFEQKSKGSAKPQEQPPQYEDVIVNEKTSL